MAGLKARKVRELAPHRHVSVPKSESGPDDGDHGGNKEKRAAPRSAETGVALVLLPVPDADPALDAVPLVLPVPDGDQSLGNSPLSAWTCT